jgi:hypothetical protein
MPSSTKSAVRESSNDLFRDFIEAVVRLQDNESNDQKVIARLFREKCEAQLRYVTFLSSMAKR